MGAYSGCGEAVPGEDEQGKEHEHHGQEEETEQRVGLLGVDELRQENEEEQRQLWVSRLTSTACRTTRAFEGGAAFASTSRGVWSRQVCHASQTR